MKKRSLSKDFAVGFPKTRMPITELQKVLLDDMFEQLHVRKITGVMNSGQETHPIVEN